MSMSITKIRFTKSALLALELPTSNKRRTVYDSAVPKLALRMTAAGTRTFYVVRRVGQQMTWVKIGAFPDVTVEKARVEAQKVLGEFAGGANPAAARRAFRRELTLDEFFAVFAERHGKGKRSWGADQQRYRDYLHKPLGHRKLSTVTRGMIADAVDKARKAGKAVATVRNIRALASCIFGQAVEWEYLDENPALGIKVAGTKVTRDRFLQAKELPRFFAAVAEESELMRDFILLALLTGVRRSNLREMRWEDIDLAAGVWRVPHTKNDDPHNVTLSPEAIEILKARKKASVEEYARIALRRPKGAEPLPEGYAFPGSGKAGHLSEPQFAVKRVMERAGIPYGRDVKNGVTLHDLRRTLGSWQARTGASLAIIGKSLNHKSPQATAIYARLDLDPVRASVNTATAAMMEAAGVKDGAKVGSLVDKASAK